MTGLMTSTDDGAESHEKIIFNAPNKLLMILKLLSYKDTIKDRNTV